LRRFGAVVLLIVSLLIVPLSGCGPGGTTLNAPDTPGAQIVPDTPGSTGISSINRRISVVCTVFPQYDWVRCILGGASGTIDLTLLSGGGADLHSFQPSVDDIVTISTCDLFVFTGGESDGWVKTALKQAVNPGMIALDLVSVLGDGVKADDGHDGQETGSIGGISSNNHESGNDDDDDDYGHDGHDHQEGVVDEHVWLSLRNAVVFCSAIADALAALDAGNAAVYRENLAAYTGRLSDLDKEYQAVVNAAPADTLLFADRFPFRYLMDDYGIGCFAAFPGCSADTEASFGTIVYLAEKIDELDLKNVMVTESSDKSVAKTIINCTTDKNQQILVLDSMQSLSLDDIKNGTTYLSIMESNLSVLKEALGQS